MQSDKKVSKIMTKAVQIPQHWWQFWFLDRLSRAVIHFISKLLLLFRSIESFYTIKLYIWQKICYFCGTVSSQVLLFSFIVKRLAKIKSAKLIQRKEI